MEGSPAPTRSTIANELEETAMAVLKSVGPLTADRDKLPYAQAFATMALSQRVAALTDALGDYLGDDSNLQRIGEHPTAAQRRVLQRCADGREFGANRSMIARLIERGWLEGSIKDGYILTSTGRAMIGA